jgi:hypothetical protein
MWLLEDDDLRPLHYLGGTSYALLGERLEARVRTSTESSALEGESAEEREEREEREALRREREASDPGAPEPPPPPS